MTASSRAHSQLAAWGSALITGAAMALMLVDEILFGDDGWMVR